MDEYPLEAQEEEDDADGAEAVAELEAAGDELLPPTQWEESPQVSRGVGGLGKNSPELKDEPMGTLQPGSMDQSDTVPFDIGAVKTTPSPRPQNQGQDRTSLDDRIAYLKMLGL